MKIWRSRESKKSMTKTKGKAHQLSSPSASSLPYNSSNKKNDDPSSSIDVLSLDHHAAASGAISLKVATASSPMMSPPNVTPRTSRSLGVGVSFGDLVSMDSHDDDDDGVTESEFDSRGRSSTHSSDNGVEPEEPTAVVSSRRGLSTTTTSATKYLPLPPSGCAPSPPKYVVKQPDLGGESSHPNLTSDEEERLIQILYDKLTVEEQQQLSDSSMITRHLRAENGHIDKTLLKCRAALQWRQSFGVSHMHLWKDMLLRENSSGKMYVRGYDREGRAYLYMRSARENTHNEQDNMKHLVWNLEKAIACTRRKSRELLGGGPSSKRRPLEKINLIIDYENFSLRNAPPMSTSKFTLDVLQKHYPERMYRAYCVNAPSVFKTFWMLIKPWIDHNTKQKIVFVTTEDCQALVQCAERIDKLEPVVGGPSTCRPFDSTEYLNLPFDQSFDEN